ncbi:MAG: ribonuclease H-like domain-containing protein [Candidatus Colwellbacteria bacterium]|nr:ribonuclease H-like domain-containing protein [Candidatus Colwellbacteria bacterium]
MAKIVFDIETVGGSFDELDDKTKSSLASWAQIEGDEIEGGENRLAIENAMGLSPLTGEVVALGVLDASNEKGAVYYQAPGEEPSETEEGGIKYKTMTEEEILKQFWNLAMITDDFIGFNSRGFDVPFLMIRSAIKGIRPSRDLMSNRYLSMQRDGRHIDLFDQLSFYGAVGRNKGSLHMWCRAFGIESPKEEGVSGDAVGSLFKEKKFIDIAKYNARDIIATKKLYDYWAKYLQF